ncbi:hypothetical protein EV193_103397 [Herbihabitans rhizosphaerae]|uniref:Uncharacterized protein n=1 Tax=Herbihabitans rhizosphaerae TaxID=1872711 RepID=A0A4Q7KVM4_9PSEU|nr:hypothetical protein [Herbihabitans rhizosphaerae]RZS41079.1 hypothetical protein EV193_103397 [Herbihabitans rhizosphaerae]
MPDRTYSEVGTARGLVMLATALALGGAVMIAVVVIAVALMRPGGTGAVVGGAVAYLAIVVITAVVAMVLAFRGDSRRRVLVSGCGLVAGGTVLGLIVLALFVWA